MYKSSPVTFIFKYIFPFMMLGGGALGLFFLTQSGDQLSVLFAKIYAVALLWVSIFLVQLPFRLKSIVANENGIKINSDKEKIITYNLIESISLFDLTNPWMYTIKYLDKKSGNHKNISYIPNPKYRKLFDDDDMTKFMKDKIKTENPNYHKLEQPSMIKNLATLLLLAISFFCVMLFVLNVIFP